VAVIGGRLQGLEAVYLSKKAGWEVTLIDKCSGIPAQNICDHFYELNICDAENAGKIFKEIDLIIPALENQGALNSLAEISQSLNLPYVFDPKSYNISVSKTVSDRLFADLCVPAPVPWPDCGFPVIVKPVESSGSEGVLLISNPEEFAAFRDQAGSRQEEWVVQEYLPGPSYSIEVIGFSGRYLPLQVTELEMDDLYDCKRVQAPSGLSAEHEMQFAQIARTIAGRLGLKGVMDVEVILHDNMLKVLEIDARLPSQTPTAVYKSTGINILELLAESYLKGRLPEKIAPEKQQAAIFEHIVVSPDLVAVSGEHAVSSAGPLNYREGFFGADEALTNYVPGNSSWMATIINTGASREEAFVKRDRVIRRIMKAMKIDNFVDPLPLVKNYNNSGVSGHDQASG
jgi:3-methylornithine--L-lysine ligase